MWSATYVAAMQPHVATSVARSDEAIVGARLEHPFRRIVCAIDGSRTAREAARQAAALAASDTVVELVAVAEEWGVGLNASALLTKAHARRALAQAGYDLRHLGVRVETRIVSGFPPYETLMRESAGRDLLVIGRHGRSRLGGMAVGRSATNLIHRCKMPLLVAAFPPEHRPFPGHILVAADGPGHPERAVRLAGLIARHSGSDITLVRIN